MYLYKVDKGWCILKQFCSTAGVQNGINSALDTIKFILVIALPENETFGWLILASFASICIGAIFYASYAVKLTRNEKTPQNPTTLYQATSEVDLQNAVKV